MTPIEKSIDFDPVARYYDACITTSYDVPFWIEEARQHPGPKLELMCGSGRLTLALLKAGHALTGVDYSSAMVGVLKEKLVTLGLTARILEGDARNLVLPDRFAWIFIGFHAFAELATEADQRAALATIRTLLAPGGQFTCSLHNPLIRGKDLNGQWAAFGTHPLGNGHRVQFEGRYDLDPETGLTTGLQRYREEDAQGGLVAEVQLPIRFRLISSATFEALAREAGFRVVETWGDYERRPLDPSTSPFLIYRLAPIVAP